MALQSMLVKQFGSLRTTSGNDGRDAMGGTLRLRAIRRPLPALFRVGEQRRQFDENRPDTVNPINPE